MTDTADLIIRHATGADAGALTGAFSAAYAKARATIPDLPDVTGDLAADIRDKTVWIVECRNQVAGGLVLDVDGPNAHLVNLAIVPEFSGRGFGSRLITTALDHCRSLGARTAHLATHKDMAGNVALYEHLGWRVKAQEGNKIMMLKIL